MNYKDRTNESQSVEGINRVLDDAIHTFRLKNDAALSKFLGFAPPVLSKLRHGKLPMGATHILRLHEVAKMDVAYIREMIAVKGEE